MSRRYMKYKCPHCDEEVPVDREGDVETFNDWMTEYGWYKTERERWVCPDCYECEGLR